MLRWRYQDDLVDELIAQNAARPRPGMDKPDLEVLARFGQTKWTETLMAQQRHHPGPGPSATPSVEPDGDPALQSRPAG